VIDFCVGSLGRSLAAGVLALGLLGCAGGYRATRISGNLYRVECGESMDHCIRGADRVCHSRPYRLVTAGKTHLEYGGKGGYQTRSSLRELVVYCGQTPADGPPDAELIRETRADEKPHKKKASSKPKARRRASAKPSCTPGETQRCVGPAACEGGQSCKEDGSGFSACDCGAAPKSEPVDEATSGDPQVEGTADGAE
jgi:hypothetical protein